jgi:hypothetical protein
LIISQLNEFSNWQIERIWHILKKN